MPITSLTKDPQALTLTIVADFPVPVRRLWDAYADPRQLERFWGPPQWPATFTRHDMAPGGQSQYFMTGPDGSISAGYFEFINVEPGRSFEVRDGFVGEDGRPNPDMPTIRMVYLFDETPTGSRVTTTSWFNSAEELEQLVEMGMEEGTRAAMGQMDQVLADMTSFAHDLPVQSQLLGDDRARLSRVIRGDVDQVWAAHEEPELLKQWLLGPDGWTMPVCEVATRVGETYRYEWRSEATGEQFGFTGELLESQPPHRSVTTEKMIGTDGPVTRNEMTLTPVQGGTLLTLLITYPDAATREMVLGTGMTDGMETSYRRLEETVLVPAA